MKPSSAWPLRSIAKGWEREEKMLVRARGGRQGDTAVANQRGKTLFDLSVRDASG